jgi:endonuclease-3
VVTEKLFLKYKTLDDYCKATQKEMEKDVFSCGFYRNKAKNIIGAAQKVQADLGGVLPQTMEELLTIPGVARKTANVILSVIFGKQLGIAVDTHVRRFAIRFDLSDYTDPVRIEKDLMEILPLSSWWGFNHRLVHYGRHVCKANKHDCSFHPLSNVYLQANTIWPKSK